MTLDLDALRRHWGPATQTPWELDGRTLMVRGRGIVAVCPRPQEGGLFDCADNAKLIHAACNNFDAMLSELLAYRARDAAVAELERAARELTDARDAYSREGGPGNQLLVGMAAENIRAALIPFATLSEGAADER